MFKGNTMRRVAVVGAGMAGLTCAQTLQSSGFEVTVFEKSRGAGGRLSTRRTDGAQYDHGAQYFTVRDAAFASFVQAQLIAGTVAVWQPRVDHASAPQRSEPWYVGAPGMSALGRAQAKGLDLRTEARVQTLSREHAAWTLNLEDKSAVQGFDVVVVAVPNEQASPLLAAHVPDWALALDNIAMQPCWTMMLSTAEALTEFDAGLPLDSAIGWWARNSSKPARPVVADQHDWVIQATPQWTQAHLDTDKLEVERALMSAFLAVLGLNTITPLQPVMLHRWLYARREPGPTPYPEPWWQPDLKLGVCGDGLSHSRVEQAYLSGLHLAQAITARASV